jgi:hypothetical protein
MATLEGKRTPASSKVTAEYAESVLGVLRLSRSGDTKPKPGDPSFVNHRVMAAKLTHDIIYDLRVVDRKIVISLNRGLDQVFPPSEDREISGRQPFQDGFAFRIEAQRLMDGRGFNRFAKNLAANLDQVEAIVVDQKPRQQVLDTAAELEVNYLIDRGKQPELYEAALTASLNASNNPFAFMMGVGSGDEAVRRFWVMSRRQKSQNPIETKASMATEPVEGTGNPAELLTWPANFPIIGPEAIDEVLKKIQIDRNGKGTNLSPELLAELAVDSLRKVGSANELLFNRFKVPLDIYFAKDSIDSRNAMTIGQGLLVAAVSAQLGEDELLKRVGAVKLTEEQNEALGKAFASLKPKYAKGDLMERLARKDWQFPKEQGELGLLFDVANKAVIDKVNWTRFYLGGIASGFLLGKTVPFGRLEGANPTPDVYTDLIIAEGKQSFSPH